MGCFKPLFFCKRCVAYNKNLYSKSIKTTSASEERGIDGGEKVKGRKHHIVTDTMGHLLKVKVHAANIHDAVSGGDIFRGALAKYPTIKGCCADEGYRKTFENIVLSIVKSVCVSCSIIIRSFCFLINGGTMTNDFTK